MTRGSSVHRRSRRLGLAALVLAAGLSGCGVNLLPGLGTPADVYDLTPKSTFPEGLPKVSWQLVVEEPFGSRAVDTDRIVVRPTDYQVSYFKGARWSDRAPRLVQTLLVESFENTRSITGVGRQAIGLRGNYDLKSELREFHAEYQLGGAVPVVYVRLNFKVVRQPSALIIGSETFERRVEAAGDSMPAIVAAFDDALGAVLKRSVVWTIETVEAFEEANGRTGVGTRSRETEALELLPLPPVPSGAGS